MLIRIVRRPDGEAPEWVRNAWVGVSLQTHCEHVHKMRGFGVLSGPTSCLAQLWASLTGRSIAMEGYLVDAAAAVDRLEEASPPAARWWREHVPHLLEGRGVFMFEASACRREAE